MDIGSIRFDHYQQAIFNAPNPADGIGNGYIDIHNCTMDNVRNAIYLSTTYNSTITNIDVTNFTKKAFDIRGGADYLIQNCTFNGGGAAYATDDFMVGIHIGTNGTGGTRIHIKDCTVQNIYKAYSFDVYWQGDGFADETQVSYVTYENCKAWNCTDGGFDTKSGATFIGCVAWDCKRPFRLWDHVATLTNCLSHDSNWRGGTGGPVDLWVGGGAVVNAYNCTFHNVSAGDTGTIIEIESGTVNLFDSIFSSDANGGSLNGTGLAGMMSGEAGLHYSGAPYNSVAWRQGVTGTDPAYVNPTPDFNGVGNNYNSQTYPGGAKGYSFQTADWQPVFVGLAVGDTVSGTIFVRPDASTMPPITRVVYIIDGNPTDTETASPFTLGGSAGFDTSTLSNGSHVLSGTVTAGGTEKPYSISFTVQNAAQTGNAHMVGLTDGQTVSGIIYFGPDLNEHPDVRKAKYFLNDTQYGSVYLSPFYWGGPSGDGTQGFDTQTLPNGTYTLSGYITTNAGDVLFTPIRFTVANGANQQSSAHMIGLTDGETVSGIIYFGPDLNEHPDVRKAAYYLDGTQYGRVYNSPYYWGGPSGDGTEGFDTRTLPNGTYTLSGYITTSAGDISFATITITVSN